MAMMGAQLWSAIIPIIAEHTRVIQTHTIILYLNNLKSGDVVGDKVEIVAEYCSFGKPKSNVLEGIVGQALAIPQVVSAGWEVL